MLPLLFKVYHDTLFLATPHCLHEYIHNIQSTFSSIFKQQLNDISTVLNNTGNTTKLLISFNTLDESQQKVLLSSKLLTEVQKEQCLAMSTLSAANTKYTAEQIAKITGTSAETLSSWGLTKSTDTLTISELAEKAASDSQAKSTLEKIIAQNAQAVANGEVTASNITLTASESTATLATGAFTTAIKANISALKTWLLTTPTGWLTIAVGVIFVAVKAYKSLTSVVEKQKEKMEEAISTYKDAQSKLSNITTELKSQEQAMDDLLRKDKLTYAEKGQLKELQAITQELRIQKNLTEKEESNAQKKSAEEAAEAFKKEFSSYDISEDAINNYLTQAYDQGTAIHLQYATDNISAMIAGYKIYNEYLDEAYNNALQDDIDDYSSIVESFKSILFSKVRDLQQQKDAMSDYYQSIKDIPYKDLTTEQKEIVDAYSAIPNIIQLVYQQIDPNSWNIMQIDGIFDTEGIEKTKDELVKMAEAGELTPEIIKGYKILNEALDKTTLSAEDLCNELYAIAESQGEVQDSSATSPTSFSLSDSQSEALDTYDKVLDNIKKVYQEYKDLDSIDIVKLFEDTGFDFTDFLSGDANLETTLTSLATYAYKQVRKTFSSLSDSDPIIIDLFNKKQGLRGEAFGWEDALHDINTLKPLLEKVKDDTVFAMNELDAYIKEYDLSASLLQVDGGYKVDEEAVESLLNKAKEEYNTALALFRTYLREQEFSEEAIDSFFGLLNLYYETIDTSSSSLSSSANDFEQQIDWAAQSVSNLKEKVSDLENALDNTKGWEAQLKAIQDVIDEQEKLREGYRKSRESYLAEYNKALQSEAITKLGLSDSVKNKIESGNLFDIESFIDSHNPKNTDKGEQERLYDAIQKAMDWYDKYVDADNNYIDIGFQIDENELEKLNVEAEHLSAVREKLETALNGTISDSDKLGLLSQLATALENDYKKQIEIAKAEQNSEEAEKLELELKQELYDLDQQRLELSREITESEIEQLEVVRTNIQNQIDLNGGKGTAEQYHALIANENGLLEKRTAEYESEVLLLQKIGTEIGINSTEYREQLKVVNECADEIAECEKNTREWEIAILSLPLDELEEKIEELNKKLEDVNDKKSAMDDIIAGAQAYIQDEIDGYEELKKNIQDQIDALQESNDERERALNLQKALSAIGEEGIWDYEQIDRYTASYKNLVVTVGELEDAINSWEDFKRTRKSVSAIFFAGYWFIRDRKTKSTSHFGKMLKSDYLCFFFANIKQECRLFP